MRLTYGNYRHEIYETSASATAKVLRTPRGHPYAVERRIALKGQLHAETQSELKSKIENVLQAYSQDGGDFSLDWNDGAQTPDLAIRNRDCIGGIRVISRPTNQQVYNAEYSTYWDYAIELEAIERIAAVNTQFLWSFEETIEFTGTGGPSRVGIALKRERGDIQRPRRFTLCHAVQSGKVVGLNGPPDIFVPRPRWAAFENEELRRYSFFSPKNQNGTFTEFGIAYSYSFIHNAPFPGSPYATAQ
ncbi:hypothetical protein KOR42_22590 [Thalassoglobus neptunius]|uniref:Uncharacterized protein n=1 Tax=Thalassoglobus neptunius TaxID=1938619 RepID=A0A5C5XAI4_9PLAN|nr:hypothetical protein [Thalassoglobus neptunius]TWT58872.1 hypothetical protein KOR42_22590 [Thalassoglobus neptunius]